jgi:DUF4097 and DUF4098 domain-containing protein YvlB
MTEQSSILDMLSEGKITADEAERLLAVLVRPATNRATADSTIGAGRHEVERVTVRVQPDRTAVRDGSRDDSFAVGQSPTLVVTSHNGRVVVRAGAENTIRVRAKLKNPSRVDYQAGQEGDAVTVYARQKGKSSLIDLFGQGGRADIEVTAPKSTEVEIKSANGRLELHGIEASGTLHTSNGRIVVGGAKGEYDAETSNGRIELRAVEGSGALRTSNGKITMDSVKGEFSAATSNGSISFEGEMTPGGKNRLTTTNGSVTVKLRGTPSLEVDASASMGKVSSALPALRRSAQDERGLRGTSLRGTIGDGEAELLVRTTNGSVSIE